ncbi:TolC family protein [Novacetimonas hansenii]|uniref:TolC family protein n=1 Tax=Novacetimonas hansenii TaxID=436 RepID=UPI00094F7E49|nr:TolC family protein [Novacetimonas hansenii]PYD71930.1 hypothetical protein CFR74_12495 [Novacetimonas hansenii]
MSPVSNQNVKEYEAKYRKARALVTAARASLYPTLSGSLNFSRNSQGGTATSTSGTQYSSGMTRNTYAAELTADWTIDVWGKIRRQIQEQVTAAQASAADLANAQLSYQEQLAEDYFELRYAADVSLSQYQYGTAIYTTVLTSQQTALSTQETALQIQESRLVASVKLIVDLGGGWNTQQLPSKGSLQEDNPLIPAFLEKHSGK